MAKKPVIYINLGPKIKGDISAEGYEDCIRAKSLVFSVDRPITNVTGENTRRGGAGAELSAITFQKDPDGTTPLLFQYVCAGADIGEVTIYYTQQGEDKISTIQQIDLTDCIISSFNQKTENEKHFEEVSISYGSMVITVIPHDENNKPGAPIKAGFNVGTAVKI